MFGVFVMAMLTAVGGRLCRAAGSSAATRPTLQVSFDEQGLASVRLGGAEVLHPGAMGLPYLDLRHGFPPAVVKPVNGAPKASFDSTAHRLTQAYPWGTLACTYRAEADRLGLDVEVSNTGKDSIFGLAASLLQLELPGPVTRKDWVHGWPTPSALTDAPPVMDVSWRDGTIAICNDQGDRPLWLELNRVGGTDRYAVTFRHDGPPRGQEISGGTSRRFTLSLRFGPTGATAVQLAPDVYAQFAQRYPSELKWDDRRPIGCNFCSSMDDRSPTNPSGWLHDKTVDTTTEAGRADWRQRMLARFDKSASVAKEMGCQGVIVWDIEGQRNAQPISYIGDPRLMPTLSPEMDAIADQCFKKYTDAGLRCGTTLRPTHVVRMPGGAEGWEHINVEDIAAEIGGKLAYARKRWGCTIFYVDSTVRWDLGADGQFALHTIPAEIFQTLHRQFPDVLLIPEESSVRHFAYTAPYHEIMPPQGYTGTPADVKAIYPHAFSMIRVADAPVIERDADALVKAIRGGDIIMFRTWLDDPDNVPVKRILAAAAAKPSAATDVTP